MLRTGEVRFVAQGDWGSRPNLSTAMTLSGDVIVTVDADFWEKAPSAQRRTVVDDHIATVVREVGGMKLPSDLIRRWARTAGIGYTGASALIAYCLNPPATLPTALFLFLACQFASPRWLLLPLHPLAKFYVRRLFRQSLSRGSAP